MRSMKRLVACLAALTTVLAACSSGGGGGGTSANDKHGPITMWYSNNPVEITWAKQMINAWNAQHPKEKISAQEIPAGKSSEEVIAAAITAGNTPCLVFNTWTSAVPQFQRAGGLVALDSFPDGADYITSRTGDIANQYKSADGHFYQMPWKDNPVMIFYNKDIFAKAGLDPNNPPLHTYSEFLDSARKIVQSGAAQAAIWPAASAEFYQSIFDFYPLYIAETGGTPLVDDGKATFDSPAGERVADFLATFYREGLAPKENYNGDAFGDAKSAMSIVGPWAISAYSKVHWGVVPLPTSQGKSADQTFTFPDSKSIGMYTSCKNRGTAWDVMKFATSKAEDGTLLDMTGEMPMRSDLVGTYPDYFTKHPEYKVFADQASRTTEAPLMDNSVAAWQAFRNEYIRSVILGKEPVSQFLSKAADAVNKAVSQK